MADDDIYSMLANAEPDDKERMAAIAAALRGQTQNMNQQQFLGSYIGGYNPTMGNGIAQRALEQQQGMVGGVEKLRQLGLQKVTQERELAAQQNALRHQGAQEDLERQRLGIEQWRLQHPEGNKGAPEAVVQKINNQLSAMADLDALEKAQSAVGPSAITGGIGPGLGAEGAYKDAIKAHGAAVAAASLPLGRETPESVSEEVAKMPSGAISKNRAGAYWAEKRKAILDNAEAQIRSLEPIYSPSQVGELRARLEAAKKRPGSTTAAAQPQQHPQADAAIDWAKKNPKDPRAKEILKRVGGK